MASLEILETALLALFIFFATRLVVQNFRVQGPSMRPTLASSELVLVSKLSYMRSTPSRGDVIVFRKPGGDREDLVKRIIGLPNETIEVRTGRVFVNGLELDESAYIIRAGNSRARTGKNPGGNLLRDGGQSIRKRRFEEIRPRAADGRGG